MRPFSELHVYDDVEPHAAALNMAIDEALLEWASVPSLRFYRWERPSLSFGYFGSFTDVTMEESSREIVRRWTGGGTVLHGSDLTYSVILPSKNGASTSGSRVVYAQIHQAIREAFSGTRDVLLASEDAPKISDACFANPVTADVLLDGRKIAGAAQRRTRAGLLHQGSIQYESLPPNFRDAFASALCPDHIRRFFPAELVARAEAISDLKYGTAEWLRRR